MEMGGAEQSLPTSWSQNWLTELQAWAAPPCPLEETGFSSWHFGLFIPAQPFPGSLRLCDLAKGTLS